MDKALKDAAARTRIVTALDRHMLVEAGAGSGKTHMMAMRMAAGIASGAYQVEGMAAVTFTRKAAAELRGRFQLALETRLMASNDAAEIDRIRVALSGLERFFAGTIHSFCARLLRERPVEAGLSPGFTELDDAQDTLRRQQSWRDYRAEARAGGDPDIRALIEGGVEPAHLDGAFTSLCIHEDVAFPGGDAECPDGDAALAALGTFLTALQKKLLRPIDADTTCKTQEAILQTLALQRVAGPQPSSARIAELIGYWKFEPAITQNRWADDTVTKKRLKDEIIALHTPFRDQIVTPYLSTWRQYLYRLSMAVLVKARERAVTDRRRDNTLNYGDLLQITARVLRTNAQVRAALQRKYRWLFVDEFQDTDPVQAEILFSLAEGDGSVLFVVGDPKQSIYRFTRADIDTYNRMRARIEQGMGEVVTLTSNFRSHPALCGWANEVFAQKFPSAATQYSPQFAPLDAARDGTDSPKDRKKALLTLTIGADVDKAEVSTVEATAIAAYIRSEVDAKRRGFGDFLILTRKKKDRLTPYVTALEHLQIPVEVSGAGAFGDSVEVRTLALLLRALADPQDSVSLIGVLRGPLFGLSDRALFDYRQAGGSFSIFAESAANSAAAAAVASALASLGEMFRWTRVMPASAALERVLERTGYLALAATSPGGVEAGDLLHAVDRVRVVMEDGGSLIDAAAAMEEDALESSGVESLPLQSGRTDVVRVMNLHKAKGLEAPVVFLADPLGGLSSRVDIRIVRGEGGATGYLVIAKKSGEWGRTLLASPAHWDDLEAEELRYLSAEVERLLYVASTRAKDLCIVGRWDGNSKKAAWAALDAHLSLAGELQVPTGAKAPAAEKVNLTAAAAAKARAVVESSHIRVVAPSWSANAVTAETKFKPVTRPGDASDPTSVVSEDTPSRRADAGVAWGTLMHGLLEHAMRHKTATRDDLRRLALWLTVEEVQLRPFIGEALDTVQAVANAEWWPVARAADECYEEAPLSVLESDGALPKVLTGTIDLVYRNGAQWQVIDYKTDADAGTADLNARYSAQIAAYERAWKKVAGGEITSTIVGVRNDQGSTK